MKAEKLLTLSGINSAMTPSSTQCYIFIINKLASLIFVTGTNGGAGLFCTYFSESLYKFQKGGHLYLKTDNQLLYAPTHHQFIPLQPLHSTPRNLTPQQTTSTPLNSIAQLNLRFFVAKSVVLQFSRFLVSNFQLEMSVLMYLLKTRLMCLKQSKK